MACLCHLKVTHKTFAWNIFLFMQAYNEKNVLNDVGIVVSDIEVGTTISQ